jgi:HEAT repeat protein
MPFMDHLKFPSADVKNLKKDGNVPALICLMGHADPTLSRQAAETLGTLGTPAVAELITALRSPDAQIRLGAIEALGAIKDSQAVAAFIELLDREKRLELRWAAILALGELESPEAVPDLVSSLKDINRYIRYGAARSLEKLGWFPSTESESIYYCIALQDWESVKKYGAAAIIPLSEIFRDPDASTRSSIIALFGELAEPGAHKICRAGLKDRDPYVRWTAVLASMNCGIESISLPPFVAARERTGPNPAAAALLNFLFLGIGYNYIGKWWGFPVFMTFMSVLVLAQLYAGPFLPYLVAYPITAVLGIHTYYLAERMSDL